MIQRLASISISTTSIGCVNNMVLVERKLPSLHTSTSTGLTSTSVSGTVTRSILSSSNTVASSTTAFSTPIITPPLADGNPNIWRTHHLLDGAVFIIVGGIAGFILLCVIIWWTVAKYKSQKNARSALFSGAEDQLYAHKYHKPSSGVYGNENKSAISLMGHESLVHDNSMIFDNDLELANENSQKPFNPIQDAIPGHYKRQSLFISPTVELLEHEEEQRRSRLSIFQQQDTSALSLDMNEDSLLAPDLNVPERAISPERKPKKSPVRKHKRNQSSISLLPKSPNISPIRNSSPIRNEMVTGTPSKNRTHAKTPSTYLDNMLEGVDDLQT